MSPKRGFRLSSTLTAFPTAAHTSNPAPLSLTAWSLPANSKLLSLRSGGLLERQGNSKDGEEYIDTGFVLGKLCHPKSFTRSFASDLLAVLIIMTGGGSWSLEPIS